MSRIREAIEDTVPPLDGVGFDERVRHLRAKTVPKGWTCIGDFWDCAIGRKMFYGEDAKDLRPGERWLDHGEEEGSARVLDGNICRSIVG